MRILAIETSCDETSAAVVEKNDTEQLTVLSSTIASSSNLHALTGGIIPENAAREQLHYIHGVIAKSVYESTGKTYSADVPFSEISTLISESIDTIAVTQGPGLIGSLLIGVETAKTLAYTYNKPLIPVNHLLAHIYANFITHPVTPTLFPFIGLIVSGGHTDLLLFTNHDNYTWLGGTRDDAAGEAFDKIGRILSLPYPAGPEIEKKAKNAKSPVTFSRALIHSGDFDFSFSGLKTEASRFIQKHSPLSDSQIADICAGVQHSIVSTLVTKTLQAAMEHSCTTILLGGGVSANQALRDGFDSEASKIDTHIRVFYPDKIHTTDNAAMIGAYAAYNNHPVPLESVQANPSLYLKL